MARRTSASQTFAANWPMLALLVGCYVFWGLATVVLPLWLAIPVLVVTLTLHSSLTHEAIHGHPTRHEMINAALVFPAIGFAIPYLRFRDQHLAHHQDSILTDPYDDPESNYYDPAVWEHLSAIKRAMLNFNNTLAGRMLIGPLIGQIAFMRGDATAIARGDKAALRGWLWHIPACAVVFIWLVAFGQVPIWAYVLSAYGALSILKVRTFLEHQAHTHVGGRTVVIEDRGLFALLFLNNNFHLVHHMHPDVPWHQLPALYFDNAARYLGRNQGYRYGSYAQIFRQYFLTPKDQVAHPLWKRPDA